MKTVFLDAKGLDELNLSGLHKVCGPMKIYQKSQPVEVASRIETAEIVILNKVKMTRELLDNAKNLRLIAVVATGTDCVDLAACRDGGITVVNCRAYGTASVAQHIFTSILALSTSLIQYHEAVRSGRWQQSDQFCFLEYPITELCGKKLGIVGFGTLGKGVAKLAEAFGMEILVAARPGLRDDTRPSLAEILPQIDVLTLHCPLTSETTHLIGKKELSMMKSTAILVNGARGGIVDEAALAEALKNGEIGGAAVDVLTKEPPVDGNPLLDEELPNLLVTPHIAWASVEARQRILDQTAENIAAFLGGEQLRVVEAS
ncbi:D-2-hydroxyacid dehydrogenase [Desulfopila sp. IMCC35008]|uniref:D-2-hydroxyacid dehydrogenase n=1 Tax=Desulfopila sp. IMCC35008 TaxID=2653858 RepID=UPI0013D4D552|nr:D-2-hydroxyacid dehydrogenase [Desulfopila sp. IMCC35008]